MYDGGAGGGVCMVVIVVGLYGAGGVGGLCGGGGVCMVLVLVVLREGVVGVTFVMLASVVSAAASPTNTCY